MTLNPPAQEMTSALLRLASNDLKNVLPKNLRGEQKFSAAMIARALAIAADRLDAMPGFEADWQKELQNYLNTADGLSVLELEKILIKQIRLRKYDPHLDKPLRELLRKRTRNQLSITDPEYPNSVENIDRSGSVFR